MALAGPEVARTAKEDPLSFLKRCPSRDVSRDDRDGDQADRTRTLTCVADGLDMRESSAASAVAPRVYFS